VWEWGGYKLGTVGIDKVIHSLIPSKVIGLDSVSSISVGQNHSLALKQNGTVWAWGNNGVGQLGDGTVEPKLVPTQVLGLSHTSRAAAFVGFEK
jgi:alpha-tubulin suppressor-like RCC1 family protein